MATDGAFKGQTYPEGPGKNTPLGPLAKNIWPHVLQLYAGSPKSADFEIYEKNAVFEDPIMRAQGVPQIKSAFYSLAKLFTVAKIVEYSVEESETSPGTGQIVVLNQQHYQIMGRDFDTDTKILLQVKDGKVTHHEDRWNGKELNFWTRPIRRTNMFVTHVLMGFGKDPKNAI